jgi:hypothetical protein
MVQFFYMAIALYVGCISTAVILGQYDGRLDTNVITASALLGVLLGVIWPAVVLGAISVRVYDFIIYLAAYKTNR